MAISATQVRSLREQTGAGILDAKRALTEAGGDVTKAIALLRKQGKKVHEKKSGRVTRDGYIETYVHGNHRVGVVVEVRCETDFVARNPEFQAFVHELALQVAATNPRYVAPEDVPEEVVMNEREIAAGQVKGKPVNVVEKVVAGKLEKFYAQTCLLKQPTIRDDSVTVEQQLHDIVAKVGEKVTIRRFVRFSLDDAE